MFRVVVFCIMFFAFCCYGAVASDYGELILSPVVKTRHLKADNKSIISGCLDQVPLLKFFSMEFNGSEVSGCSCLGSKKTEIGVRRTVAIINEYIFMVNFRDKKGVTLLMLAAKSNDLVLFRALVSLGSDYNVTDFHNKSVYDYAVENKSINVIKYMHYVLEINSSKESVFIEVSGETEGVKGIVKRGDIFDAISLDESLAVALYKLNDFINKGFDIHHADDGGVTILMLAAEDDNVILFLALIALGADRYAEDNQGDNSYDYAEMNSSNGVMFVWKNVSSLIQKLLKLVG